MNATAPHRQTTRAIVMVIAAIFCFTVMDAGVKALAPKIGVLPTLWARYSGQMMLVLLLVAPRLRSVAKTQYPKLQVLRSILLMTTTALFFVGITRIPLSDATALIATNPVLITLGAAIFLGETLGLRRIIGIGVALCGALVIIRPGSEVFSVSALYPLGAAVCYSAYALLTRHVGRNEDPWTSLFYTGLVGSVLLSAMVPFAWQPLDTSALALMALITVAGTVGQLALIRAFSWGEAAMLAPYTYCGLIFATFWGFAFFSEVPDRFTLLGAAIIAASGIYVWYRETHRST